MKHYFKGLFLSLLITASVQAQGKNSMPAGWEAVDACDLSFILPSDLQDLKVRGWDSCVYHYLGRSMFIDLDVMGFSTPNDEEYFKRGDPNKRDFHLVETILNGDRALIATYYVEKAYRKAEDYHYAASLFVPRMGKSGRGVWMRTYSPTAEGQVTAQKIFESIKPAVKRRRA